MTNDVVVQKETFRPQLSELHQLKHGNVAVNDSTAGTRNLCAHTEPLYYENTSDIYVMRLLSKTNKKWIVIPCFSFNKQG